MTVQNSVGRSEGDTNQTVREWGILGRLGEAHSDIEQLWGKKTKKVPYEREAKGTVPGEA